MNKLDELIQELCPDGVEYKSFGDCAKIVRGASPRPIKNFITTEPDGVNWIKIGDVKPGEKYITSSAEKITLDGAKKSRPVKKGDFILSNSMSFGRPYILKIDGCVHDGWLAISEFSDSYVSDFLYYLLSSNMCQNQMKKKASFGGAVQNLNADIVRELSLPVPPLEVQQEIVYLLDDFTAKAAELQAELNKEYEARKKQYEYYRDTLLNDEEATRKVTLQDVAQYSKARISSSEVDETNYVGVDNLLQNKKGKVNSNHVPTSGNLTEFQSGDILIGNIRPYLQKIWLSDKTGGTNGDVLDIRPNQKLVTPPFLYQVLASDRFFNYDMQNSKGAKMPRGNKEKVMEYSFALPTLERQREIVLLLNKFEIAFNDLQSNISIELESRQKQYEFYRDKLLTFKELNESEVN